MAAIMSRTASCRRCGKIHEIYGSPGQVVTAEFTCECGQKIRLTTTFPKS